jgi:hypothetical protein
MELRGKFSIVALAVLVMLAPAFIVNAGMEQQTTQNANAQPISNSEIQKTAIMLSEAEPGLTDASGKAAGPHTRALQSYQEETDQFGDDEAHQSTDRRHNRESDSQAHGWVPNSYGLMGDYSRGEH